ncbi:hypothetical protein HNY73_001180 [Argiope bruennichi]|uniref:Uncharacterized protein n=1 Tax=Argiope bruennichi TaxID=94029 RepID=A0A8T0G0I5_ARGBR|nr:hypothetical protein HNY73_001180 [Argiope bruennichi]
MHSFQRGARVSDQHFLLDTYYLYCAIRIRKGSRQRCAPSRYRLHSRRFSVSVPSLLPVGVLYTFLPGCIVLHAKVALAHVGRRQDQGPNDGFRHCSLCRSGKETEEEDAGGLPDEQLKTARLVRCEILPVRGYGICKRRWSNVSHEPVLRRRVPQLWYRSHKIFRKRPGESNRSNDTNLSSRYQMSLLQIWIFWQRRDARCALCLATKRHQRKDFYLPVVLVHHSVSADRTGARLPGGYHCLPPCQSLSAQYEVQNCSFRYFTYCCSQGIYRRLVSSVHVRTKYRYYDLQRSASRNGKEDDYRTQGGGMTRDVSLPPTLCLCSITCL